MGSELCDIITDDDVFILWPAFIRVPVDDTGALDIVLFDWFCTFKVTGERLLPANGEAVRSCFTTNILPADFGKAARPD